MPDRSPNRSPNRSLGLKLIVVCALVVLMAIPAMFISYISFERSGRADEVTREVSQRYGGEQYISGPMLIAPYAAKHTDGTIAQAKGHVQAPRRHFTKHGWMRQQRPQTYLSVDVSDIIARKQPFIAKVNMAVTGAQRLGITPFAQSTDVSLAADWADPGFQGGFPPRQRDISQLGFSADWSVPYLRRGIRAHGRAHTLGALSAADKMMTVQFVSLDNPYQTVNRALKYSVLFIGLVFLAYFLFEVIVGVRVHPAQYILIGLIA